MERRLQMTKNILVRIQEMMNYLCRIGIEAHSLINLLLYSQSDILPLVQELVVLEIANFAEGQALQIPPESENADLQV